jgi:hypothetical protein
MTKKEYQEYLKSLTRKQRKKAYDFAVRTRDFEIDLYWKRTSYFWGFLIVIFTAYGFSSYQNEEIRFLLSIIGVIFSFSWYCVNRGSKYWQKNWEAHIDLLEEEFCGNIYKINLSNKLFKKRNIFDPYSFSISKINQNCSIVILLMWIYLVFENLNRKFQIACIPNYIPYLLFGILAVLYILLTLLSSKGNALKKVKINFEIRELK